VAENKAPPDSSRKRKIIVGDKEKTKGKKTAHSTGWQLHWLYLCFVIASSFDFILLLFI